MSARDVMTFLLGVLLTIVTGIVANLLTPTMKPLWATFLSLQRRGAESEIRQKMKVLQPLLINSTAFERQKGICICICFNGC